MDISIYPKHSAAEWCRMIVEQKTATLSQFMQSKRAGLLGAFPDEREETLNEIVDVIKLIPKDFLDEEQVGLLLEFFLGRMDSSALAGGAVIQGIHHLVLNSVHLPPHFEDSLILYMFKEGNVQSWNQRERELQFDILQWLLKHRLERLQIIGIDFVVTFMKSVSGERDPRCLLLMFNMFLQVVKFFDLKQFSEDMFETIACYFPVEFKPQPDDFISRQYLAASCASCLVASPSFASFCYLLIDEKLNDEECTDETTEDILELMVLACEKFPAGSVAFNLRELLAGIRMVALNPKNHASMSPTVEKALNAVIQASERIPSKDGDKAAEFVTDSLIDNLEPFVLQAEMGLSAKALILLKIGYLRLREGYAKKVLDQSISWIITLVQGETVNTAANRVDIVKEGLAYLIQWVNLAIERKTIGESSLKFYEVVIFESCNLSREYCPNESLIAIYECASVYLDSGIASDLLIDRLRTLIVSGLKSPEFQNEMDSFTKMVSSFAKANLNEIKLVLNSIASWNQNKIMPLLCAVGRSADSWDYVKNQIEASLDSNMNLNGLNAFEKMCYKCADDQELLWEQLMVIDRLVVNRVKTEVSNCGDRCIQSIGLVLSKDNHVKYMKMLVERFEKGQYDESLGLVVLQDENFDHIKSLLAASLTEFQHRRILFSAVNRGVVEVSNLTNEDFSELWIAFIKVKALLLAKTSAALPLFSKLLSYIADSGTDCDEMFKYLMDFERNDCNPTKCRYNTGSLLWKQRIFFMIVPKYIEAFKAAGEKSEKLIGLLQPLLEFAHLLGSIQVKSQFEMLLPLLIESLEKRSDVKDISPTVLRAIPSFLSNSEPFERRELVLIVSKLCDVLKMVDTPMPTILDCLESLTILARRQPATTMYPLISLVANSISPLLGHIKRVVRQKSAAAKNLWEMLTTK